MHREPRRLSEQVSRQKRGLRSSYIGTECFIALVDANEAPYRSALRQLALDLECTNRDLPLHMPVHQGSTVFTMESGAPVELVKCVAGPTKPKPPRWDGDTTWRLISHLSLNYLSLLDRDEHHGASALRELM